MKKILLKPKVLDSQPKDKKQTLFVTKTNPEGTRLDLFIDTEGDFIGQKVGTLLLVEEDIIEIRLDDVFELEKVTEIPHNDGVVMSVFIRCACGNRSCHTCSPEMTTFKCLHCGKHLNISHWTGRVGDENTYSIIELTNRYAEKWLKSHGWLRVRDGLWAKMDKVHTHYTDYRKQDYKPRLYAYAIGESIPEKRMTNEIKQVYREVIPYYERLTAKDISIKKSHNSRIAQMSEIPVFGDYTKHTHGDGEIPSADKCPECGENSLVWVKNNDGEAGQCHHCQYIEFKMEDKNDNSEKDGTRSQGVDSNFF